MVVVVVVVVCVCVWGGGGGELGPCSLILCTKPFPPPPLKHSRPMDDPATFTDLLHISQDIWVLISILLTERG